LYLYSSKSVALNCAKTIFISRSRTHHSSAKSCLKDCVENPKKSVKRQHFAVIYKNYLVATERDFVDKVQKCLLKIQFSLYKLIDFMLLIITFRTKEAQGVPELYNSHQCCTFFYLREHTH
jgi:hypothetical protein